MKFEKYDMNQGLQPLAHIGLRFALCCFLGFSLVSTLFAKSASPGDKKQTSQNLASGELEVSFDFSEPVELKKLIKMISLLVKKNIIFNSTINGQVHIITPKKVSAPEAYEIFLSTIAALGFTTVETSQAIKIIPLKEGMGQGKGFFNDTQELPRTDGFITQVIPLIHVQADNIRNILSKMIPAESITVYEPTNILIVSGSGYLVRRVFELVKSIDVKPDEMKINHLTIRFLPVKEMAERVRDYLKSFSGRKDASKVFTDERSNTLFFFGSDYYFGLIKAVVQKLEDSAEPTMDRQAGYYVRPIDFIQAKNLASLLTSLAAGEKRLSQFEAAKTPLLSDSSEDTFETMSDVKFTADDSSNSLVITGSYPAYKSIDAIIRRLDKQKPQVFLEVDILEVNENLALKFSPSWMTGEGTDKGTKTIVGFDSGAASALSINPSSSPSGAAAQNDKKLTTALNSDLSLGVISGKKINLEGIGSLSSAGLIKLLKSDVETKILSSPYILTSDNEEASIMVGQTFFIRKSTVDDAAQVLSNTFDKENVDFSLNVKTNVSRSENMSINIKIDANNIEGIGLGGNPIIGKKKISQVVFLKNGQTTVISGLKTIRRIEEQRTVPWLGSLPIIGYLMRRVNKIDESRDILVFLTPHIIYGENDLKAIYKSKLEGQKEFFENSTARKYDFFLGRQ